MVHDFTVLPLRITVHAPQLLVSQPTWVPVRPAASRMKWTSSVRGSINAALGRPLMVIVTCCLLAIRGGSFPRSSMPLLDGALQGTRQRASSEFFDQALLVFSRTTKI